MNIVAECEFRGDLWTTELIDISDTQLTPDSTLTETYEGTH